MLTRHSTPVTDSRPCSRVDRHVLKQGSVSVVTSRDFRTELTTSEIPEVYARFSEVVGANTWLRRAKQVKDEVRGNPYLETYREDVEAIPLALARCGSHLHRFGRLIDGNATSRSIYPALSFAAQVLSMMDLLSAIEAKRLRARVVSALKDHDAMRALRLELGTATHFVRRGYKVAWPETNGAGTYDLLVEDLAEIGLAVECKSISADKGRAIHQYEALVFIALLMQSLASVRKTLRVGLTVVATLPGRLPTQYRERVALAEQIKQQINLARGSILSDGTQLRIEEFDLKEVAELAIDADAAVAHRVIERITRTRNRQSMLHRTPQGGTLIVVLQSSNDDELLRATFETLADAAKRQLPRDRPGILIAGLDGINHDQLLGIAEQDRNAMQQPTALALRVSEFLSASHREWVVGVTFLSRDALQPKAPGHFEGGGAAYFFPKRESQFWHSSLAHIFDRKPTPGTT